MNIRTGTIFTAVALAAATLGSRAADQDAACVRAKPATAHQIAESRWFDLERQRGSGTYEPAPFPSPRDPAVVSNVPPKGAVQIAQNTWWEEERQLDDGYAWPAPSELACESIGARIARKR